MNDWSSWDDWTGSSTSLHQGNDLTGRRSLHANHAERHRKNDLVHVEEAFILYAERVLREIAIDFGMQFERRRRGQIERLIQELRFCIVQADKQAVETIFFALNEQIFEINMAAYRHDDDDNDAATGIVSRR